MLSVIAFIAGFIIASPLILHQMIWLTIIPLLLNFPYLYQTTYVSGLGALGSYNAYLVEYLPYFYFIFKPLSYIPDVTLFCIQCVVNTFAMIGFCRLSKRISVEFAVFMHYFTLVEAFSSGLWQNVEFVVFLIYTFEYVHIKENKKYTLIDVILIAGAGFKMYSFLFIPLYILFLSRKDGLKLIIYILLLQILFNGYFILIYPHFYTINLAIDILMHGPPSASILSGGLVWFMRLSAVIPVVYIIYLLALKGLNK